MFFFFLQKFYVAENVKWEYLDEDLMNKFYFF